jgi:hypothetical protein
MSCEMTFQAMQVNDRVDGMYAWLPSRLTESVIAASIIVAALNNISPSSPKVGPALPSPLGCCMALVLPRCWRIWVCRRAPG